MRLGLSVMTGVISCAAVCASSARASQIVFAAQAPLAYGEIYSVAADGSRLDLSKSPAADVAPTLSRDGKRVAFLSMRGEHAALYVVGIDGGGLRRVSPFLFAVAPNQSPIAEIAWSPDGRTIAVVTGTLTSRLYLATLSGGWRTVSRKVDAGAARPAWSSDSRRLAFATNFGLIDVVTSTGKPAWNVAGLPGARWSATGELAVAANDRTIRIYRENGAPVRTFAGQAFAWSPAGDLLAFTDHKQLQVRRVSTGKSVGTLVASEADIRAGQFGSAVEWVGAGRIRVVDGSGYIGFDVTHDRPWKLPPPAASWGSVIAGDAVVHAAPTTPTDPTVELVRWSLAGGAGRTLRTAASCGDDPPFAALQLTANGRDAVYQSGCGNPSAELFTVGPDGSGLRQLTQTSVDERQPSLSPDGRSVAFVQRAFAAKCNGCPDSIWTLPVSGNAPTQLTAPTFDSVTPFDESPSWSPDGKQIVIERSGLDGSKSMLVTVPSTGGAATSLGVIGRAPAWGPQLIAFIDAANPKPTVETLDPATGTIHTVATAPKTDDIGSLAWSNGGRLAYLDPDYYGNVSIVVVGSPAKRLPLKRLLTAGSQVRGLAWSPDGKRFAFSATDVNGVGEIYTLGVDGTVLKRVTKNAGAVGAINWR